MSMYDYEKCIDDCNKCLLIDNKFTKALRRRAYCLIYLDQIENAIKDYLLAIEIEPNDLTIK